MKAPRSPSILGMPSPPCHGAEGTWLESEHLCYPSGGKLRRARVLCPDGKLRIVRCGIADTYFSVPAVVGRTAGWIGIERGAFVYHPAKMKP